MTPASTSRLAGVLLGVVLATIASAGAAWGQQDEQPEPEPVATALNVRVKEPLQEGLDYRVAADLTTRDGTPVSNVVVSFYAVYDLVGERSAFLGRSSTSATGATSVPFTPRRSEYVIIARFAGDTNYAASEVEDRLSFPPAAVEPYRHEHGLHGLLAPVRDVMPQAITAAVALVWVGLLSLSFWTIRTIRSDPSKFDQEVPA